MDEPTYKLLPTGKQHVSFSEFANWRACSWRHKLLHVDKLGANKPGHRMDFGTACHAACESFLKTRTMDVNIALNMLKEMWEKNREYEGYDDVSLKEALDDAARILPTIPAWFDANFPNWEFIDAEHQLYESINDSEHAFKGYIDGVISCDGRRSARVVWLIDWKSTTWGWSLEKKTSDVVKSQLVFYKHFWSKKMNVPISDIRCGFILLKRTAKSDFCELVTTSVGPETLKKSLKMLNNMLVTVNKGIAIKKRESCKFCEFQNTEHCT